MQSPKRRHRRPRLDVHTFIAQRGTVGLSSHEVDRLTAEAMADLDPEEVMREVEALRARYGFNPRESD